jgi:hypothetical protein
VPIVPTPDVTGADLEDVAKEIVARQASGWPFRR